MRGVRLDYTPQVWTRWEKGIITFVFRPRAHGRPWGRVASVPSFMLEVAAVVGCLVNKGHARLAIVQTCC